MNKIAFPLLTLVLFMVSSCEKEIEFKGEVTDPLVVVNSFLMPDSVIKVELSKSRFFLDQKTDFDRINNATVSITVNSQYTEYLRFVNNGMYTGNYKPLPGDSVALLIKVPGKEDVKSSVVVQYPSTILSVDTLSRKQVGRFEGQIYNDTVIAWVTQYELEMGIRIKDPAKIKNFYRLSVFYRTEYPDYPEHVDGYYMYINLQGVGNETSSGGILGLVEGVNNADFHVFPDDLFDGKEIIIRFKISEYILEPSPGYEYLFEKPTIPVKTSYTINLQSIPRATYLYLKSKDAAERVFETIFTEPVQIYSNIENGIGIFGAITNNRKTLYNND